jgi:capsular exopolysaccharide synthesis family protein
MSTQQARFTTFTIPEKKAQTIDVAGTVKKYLYHWPLFMISLGLAISGVYFYLQTIKPVYEIKATLLIRDEKKSPDSQTPLHEIDMVNSSRLIENEFEIIKSKQLIGQVIRDLALDISYKKKNGISFQELYKTSPVKLTILKPGETEISGVVNLVIKDKNSFLITMPGGTQKELWFKDTFQNKFGTWKLEPNDNLADYAGASIQIVMSDPDKLAIQYQRSTNVALSNKLSTAVILSIDDEIPQRGRDFLNGLIFNYNLAGFEAKKEETKSTLSFIDQRLATLTGELTAAEKGIEYFKSSRGLTDISSETKIRLENMQSNDVRLNEVNVQLSVIEGIERYVNSSQNLEKSPATLGIEDPALSSLIEELAQLQLQRERLLATTPETNPDFEPINRQIVVTKSAIKENVGSIKSSLQNTREKLLSFNNRFESSIKDIPNQERQYINIKRQQEIKESLYTYLLQKREEASVSYATAHADNHIIDKAYAGPAKGSMKSLALAAALLLGLGLPIGFIYVRELLKARVTNVQDITNLIDIPILVELPFEASQNPLAISKNRGTIVGEQFRTLRIKLYHLYGKKESGRVTLITSSIPGEGKSFVCGNLGLTLAFSNRKTVILELDMRKPKIARTFNLDSDHAGISDYLNETTSLSAIIQRSGVDENLDIISAGSPIENPSELLEKYRLEQLLNELRETYDDIIIDSPPVHMVPEAMILSRLSDCTLYMIRQGVTGKSEINFIKELYNQKHLLNINLIFNGIHRVKYGYGYNYDKNYYAAENRNKLTTIFADFTGRF